MSLRSFGAPYLAPVIPLDGGVKDVLVRAPWWRMTGRARLAHPQDRTRQPAQGLKPEPPKGKTGKLSREKGAL